MPLLFKMQKALVTFSLALMARVRIGYLILQNFRETQKDT